MHSMLTDCSKCVPNEWLVVLEAARALRVSPWTVRRWIRAGRLRSIRPGQRRLVLREDVERLTAIPNATHQMRQRNDSGSGQP